MTSIRFALSTVFLIIAWASRHLDAGPALSAVAILLAAWALAMHLGTPTAPLRDGCVRRIEFSTSRIRFAPGRQDESLARLSEQGGGVTVGAHVAPSAVRRWQKKFAGRFGT